jgi:signal transduction histidine kinase
MTAYAIVRHHLFNLKVIATEALTIMIWIALLSRLAVSESTAEIIINLLILAATIIFGVLLIKSVRREVEQREELARLNVQLEKRNKQVEELSQFKTQLLSLASHQVKAPLAAIKGFASILLEGLYGKINDKVKETVEKMKRSSDSLLSLVNTLLDLRRIEEGRIEYSFTKVKFADLVREVVSGLEPLAKQKNLELSFQSSSDATINADTEKLKSVIQNLVENAIKYTPSGFVRTELKDEPSGDTVLLTVADSGLGIEEDLLPHLFEEFIREERVKREIRGTGLGLYVARRFIEAHGGQIWAESEGENKGSRFYIRLKKA